MDGLLGTFAKPSASTIQPQKDRMPSIQFTNQSQTKGHLMHGEVPVDKDFNFSQAMSSIEMRQTDRDYHKQANAIIPGYVAERVNEIGSAESDDKFGTGDFPSELAVSAR